MIVKKLIYISNNVYSIIYTLFIKYDTDGEKNYESQD